MLKSSIILSVCLFLVAPGWADRSAAAKVPGFNVHTVREAAGTRFLRGGAPRPDTLAALAKDAKARKTVETLVDLRHPAKKDDRSRKEGRLTPEEEEAQARKLGLRYVSVSAMDKGLPQQLARLQKSGDVYIHCMYGVNRTGFAVARYARANKVKVDTTGLGKRDVADGDAFQKRLEGSGR
jgi:hypothetical protein